jgi:predicted phage terminase large subunit-like protein
MGVAVKKPIDLDERLNNVDYAFLSKDYRPSKFAIHFMAFIKLVNGSMGEENVSPIIHYDMLDQICPKTPGSNFIQNLFVSFRGSAKTTAIHEYMILYLGTYGTIPNFGQVNVGMYISDTMENGIKSMRNNLEFRWGHSEFLQTYVPKARFTDVRWEFTNADGKNTVFRGFGASTGVRGFKEYGERPTWCGLDDLMSDKNAESATITRDIKNIVYKAARQAMHPKKRMVNWTGTPFNKSDPLYEAAGSNSWNTRIYPIAEKFPCKRSEFRGAWEDRFPYEFVLNEYNSLLESGEISSFNQELMLRIISDENRLVVDDDLIWFERDKIVKNKHQYNFYITSDLATSDGKRNDFTVIGVWAYTNNGDWLLIDGICKRQLMDKSVNDIFNFVSIYRPLSVGIETNGQQKGFIQWLKSEMINRNVFFNFAQQGTQEGIRQSTDKISHFKLIVPTIKAKKLWLPVELKDGELLTELLEEFRFATGEGFKSKHDDAADMVSMLIDMNPFKPSAEATPEFTDTEDGTFGHVFQQEDNFSAGGSTIF